VSAVNSNGSYGVGAVIDITISFSPPPVVTGTPQLALNSGGTANYTVGDGQGTLTFTYVVGAGQNSPRLDYTSTTALTLNGGTISDLGGQPESLTLPAPGSVKSLGANKNIAIDTIAPTVTGVGATTTNGTYGVGSSIAITVGWSKPVVVTGMPQLALNSGGTASYTSGSGTSTLTFTYMVGAGQNSPRLDYTSTSALALNGGSIVDTIANPNKALLTLPAPDSRNSLGANANLRIDTSAALLGITVTPVNPSIATGMTQQFTATGTYSDNSKRDLTALVLWGSDTSTVAIITQAGVASGVGTGTATVSAKLNGVTGSTLLKVTAPVGPTIIGEKIVAVFLKHNKKGKPIGNPVIDFVFQFSTPMNSSTARNVSNYQVAFFSTKRVKKKTVTVPHPIAFKASFNALTNTATLATTAMRKVFAKGGSITINAKPPAGISSAQGAFLAGVTHYVISPNAKGIRPGT
jgi:hypothetical protein